MSTFTTPATWANGAVTAAQMNTEIRDHLNWLKAWADIITNSTASDTSDTTQIQIARAAVGNNAITARVTGDAVTRWLVQAGGRLEWRNGTDATGLVNLYKNGDDILKTDDEFQSNTLRVTNGAVISGTSGQALYLDNGGAIELVERTDPAAPGGNHGSLYIRDTGGKSQLCIRFNTGAIQVLATQP